MLLRAVRSRLGCGAVLNTSFNIHGSPLVCTPAQAVEILVASGADWLAIGPFLVEGLRGEAAKGVPARGTSASGAVARA